MTRTSLVSHAKRFALAGTFAAAFAIALSCTAAPNAQAATTFSTKIMDRAANYTSTSYDLTGDKKADKLTIKSYPNARYRDYNDKVKVFINGKRALSVKSMYNADATVFRIKSGRTFLYLKTYTDNEDAVSEGVYTYKSGKLAKVLDTYIWPSSWKKNYAGSYHENAHISHSGVNTINVSGNTVKINFYNMTSVAGTMNETFSFKYKSGKLKLTSNTTSKVSFNGLSSKLTAATTFKIYGKSNGSGKVQKIKKGSKVTIKAVQLRPSDHFIAVKVKTAKGATGWITYKSFKGKTYTDLHNSTLFKETGMAG